MKTVSHFHPLLRLVHWLMALAIIAMLFIGLAMVSTVSPLHSLLISIHKTLGVAILLLVIVRLYLRLRYPVPTLPASVSTQQKAIASASHWLLYALMLAQPLIGWGMLSAAGYPITLWGGWLLPAILPQNPALYALLRPAHTWAALLLLAVVVLHLAAALFHAFVLRDGVFSSMSGKK